MSQTRLYLVAGKAQAAEAFQKLDATFEDDGLPLAILEADEARDLHEVSIYVEGDGGDVLARMRAALGPAVDIHAEALPDIDWVAKSLEGLRSVRAGRFLVHGSHDRAQLGSDDIGVEIDAGQAFGTGHHGTTAGCLEMIEDVVAKERPGNALDLGTGSAVLAIAIAKLAAIPVLATDIDPVAVQVAQENIRLNGVAEQVEAIAAPGLDHPAFSRQGPFDLIVANILAGPLMELAPGMGKHLKPDGSLILSGILDRQSDAVLEAYAGHGFRHLRTLEKEGWATLWVKI